MFGHHVLQADGILHGIHHRDFLARPVDEVELGLRKHNRQGDAGEAASGAEVHDLHAGQQFEVFGDGQGMQHMVLIEVLHVLARDDIDFGVPIQIQVFQLVILFLLLVGQLGEVLE